MEWKRRDLEEGVAPLPDINHSNSVLLREKVSHLWGQPVISNLTLDQILLLIHPSNCNQTLPVPALIFVELMQEYR